MRMSHKQPFKNNFQVCHRRDLQNRLKIFWCIPAGGWYMVSLKQVKTSFSNSVLAVSKEGVRGGLCAKPTPFSQMYSQLSIAWRSSARSWRPDWQKKVAVKIINLLNRLGTHKMFAKGNTTNWIKASILLHTIRGRKNIFN